VVLVTHRPGPLALADHVMRLDAAGPAAADLGGVDADPALATTAVNPW